MNRRVILTFAATVICATPTFADPIVVTRGYVSLGSFFSNFPPIGFNLEGADTRIAGVTFDQSSPFVRAGETVNLSRTVSITSVAFGPFEQTVQGVNYDHVLIQGSLNFSATPFTVTRLDSRFFTTPFTMTGAVSLFEQVPDQGPGALLLTRTLRGSGSARISLDFDFGDGSFSTLEDFSFSPAAPNPTPEPGTLLLLTVGLAAAVRRCTSRVE